MTANRKKTLPNATMTIRPICAMLCAAALAAGAMRAADTTGDTDATSTSEAPPPPSDYAHKLDALGKIYAEHLAKIQDEYDRRAAEWPPVYTQALEQLKIVVQKRGDLEAWQAVAHEAERFARDPEIMFETLVESPPELRTLQQKYRAIDQSISIEKDEKILALTALYTDKLENAQKNLTMEGRMTDAIAYNAEVRRVKSSAAVTAAEFELAAYEAAQAQRTAPVPPPTDIATTPEDNDADETDDEPWPPTEAVEVAGCMIHPGTGPATGDSQFRRLSLRPTPRGRILRKVTVQARLTDATQTVRRNDWSTGTADEIATTVFLSLRLTGAADALKKTTVLLQVYTKHYGSRGAINPFCRLHRRIPLLRLSPDTLTVVCPPLKARRWEARDSDSGDKGGEEFYGIIVSVFAENGELLYQATSASTLEDLAPAELPPAEPALETQADETTDHPPIPRREPPAPPPAGTGANNDD